MLRVVLCLAAIFTASCLVANEPNQPPTKLTRQQLSEGWICLFDGATLFGWTPVGDTKWTVFKGILAPEGDKPAALITATPFENYELVIDYQTRNENVEVCINAEINGDKVDSAVSYKFPPTGLGKGTMTLWVKGGKLVRTTVLISEPGGLGTLSRTSGGLVPGVLEAPPLPGRIALRGSAVVFHGIRLRPLEAKSLFNGKNLDGWKIFEGKKGKFAVTEQGEISVKDGPGDLATAGEYSDFTLQLECKTNGKLLNSGIFFRALPGQYQQGYEAQIQNGWLDKSKSIEVEVYDPRTNELKEKKKVETLAADFGTGAIYRRIPARQQLAEDNQWFAMTVVANGRQISTWVNGIQAVDWTDNRPLKENARQGARLEKGVISIQAHDPTTDLLFRNLRVADQARR